MKVSAQEEYGLRCLLQLATLGGGEFLTLGQIAERAPEAVEVPIEFPVVRLIRLCILRRFAVL